jgi:hypothetical protein
MFGVVEGPLRARGSPLVTPHRFLHFFRASKEEAVSDLHHVDQPSQQYFALNPASVTAQLAEG